MVQSWLGLPISGRKTSEKSKVFPPLNTLRLISHWPKPNHMVIFSAKEDGQCSLYFFTGLVNNQRVY